MSHEFPLNSRRRGSRGGDPENRACEISLARLSPRLPRRREFMRHLFVVGSLDKQIQNERELIHLASAGRRGAILYLCGEGEY